MNGADRERRRKEQIARNEVLFREVNERLRELASRSGEERTDFLCECGDVVCSETVQLSRAEYERVRSDPVLFAVAPGHATAEVEDVVERHERYDVVRKQPEEQDVARETDPRG